MCIRDRFYSACEGVYHFRFHADYGYGGFLGVDGVSHSAGDIWGHVFANDVAIAEGDHYWEALGFEGCCDGHSELEVHLPADNVADPWRQIVSGASDELVGDCTGEPGAPPPPPSGAGDSCTYTIYGQNGLGGPALSMREAVDACIDNGGQLASAHSQADADVFADPVSYTHLTLPTNREV